MTADQLALGDVGTEALGPNPKRPVDKARPTGAHDIDGAWRSLLGGDILACTCGVKFVGDTWAEVGTAFDQHLHGH